MCSNMEIKEKFQDAILSLTERNQAYVNRKGPNAYSKQMDRIINDLVEFFNESQRQDPHLDEAEKDYRIGKLQDEIARLETIFRIFNINPDQFKKMDKDFLELKLKNAIEEEEMPVISPAYFMDLEIDYLVVSGTIRSITGFITAYKRAINGKNEPIISFYRGKSFTYLDKYLKAVRDYPEISDQTIERWIEKDYYNGSIKKSIDTEAEQVKAGSESQ